MPDITWMIAAYMVGSLSVFLVRIAELKSLRDRCSLMEEENTQFKHLLTELGGKVESEALLLAIKGMTALVDDMRSHVTENKEDK